MAVFLGGGVQETETKEKIFEFVFLYNTWNIKCIDIL